MNPAKVDRLHEVLTDEFAGEVELHWVFPSTLPSQAIIIAPGGDDWLSPAYTGGGVEEMLHIVVTARMNQGDRGLTVHRDLSLRAVERAKKIGCLWLGTSAPAIPTTLTGEAVPNILFVTNRISFSYPVSEVVEQEE
jgi:hypothetical protein